MNKCSGKLFKWNYTACIYYCEDWLLVALQYKLSNKPYHQKQEVWETGMRNPKASTWDFHTIYQVKQTDKLKVDY